MRAAMFSVVLLLTGGAHAVAQAPDQQCRMLARQRAEACTAACIDKARAAVDPDVQNAIYGRACAKNCLKIQMFQGQVCP